jgi:hypothetical protein
MDGGLSYHPLASKMGILNKFHLIPAISLRNEQYLSIQPSEMGGDLSYLSFLREMAGIKSNVLKIPTSHDHGKYDCLPPIISVVHLYKYLEDPHYLKTWSTQEWMEVCPTIH